MNLENITLALMIVLFGVGIPTLIITQLAHIIGTTAAITWATSMCLAVAWLKHEAKKGN